MAIKLHHHFRPKADSELLRGWITTAWRQLDEQKFQSRRGEVGMRLVQHLLDLYPAADMQVLNKYGCAKEADSVTVLVFNPETERFDCQVPVQLSHPVLMPTSYRPLYCGGVKYSRLPNRGVNEKTRAEMEAGTYQLGTTWDEFCADQDERERAEVPEEIAPYFAEIVELRQHYQQETNQRLDIRSDIENGKYPTWDQLCQGFKIAGPYIREQITGGTL